MNHCINNERDRLAGALGRVNAGQSVNAYEEKLRAERDAQVAHQEQCIGHTDSAGGAEALRYVRVPVEVPACNSFEAALHHVRRGGRVTRAGWNAGGQHVQSQFPDKASRMTAPYLVLKNAQGDLVPWVPSQGDLFATDWALLP